MHDSDDLRSVYLHWTASDYEETFPAYHYCVALRGGVATVVETHPVAANARDLRAALQTGAAGESYAAHVAGRNSFAIGVAVCGMRDATPYDFGAFPLRDDMLELACALAAKLCARYDIPVDAEHVRTHAEAAVDDGYFGDGEGRRWDVARFAAEARPLAAEDARVAGDALALRARIRAYGAGNRTRAVLWSTLAAAIFAWAMFLWHPWIDWFGRPQ